MDEATKKDKCICWTAYKSFERSCTEPNIILFHTKESTFTEKDKYKKRLVLREFEKRVSALRNTEGGILFIHITDRTNNNSNLSEFDQFVDKSLKSLIADGCSFVESYSRKWLSLQHNILILTVAKGSCVSSVSLNTKVCSDHGIEFPSTFELTRFVSKGQLDESEATVRPEPRPFHLKSQDWVEDRHIQLKAFFEPTFRTYCEGHKHNRSDKNFVDYVWNNLRFREYLSGMSKVPRGGSYYVGIAEWKKQVVPDVHGIHLKGSKTDITKLFKQKLTTVTVYSFDDKFKSGQKEENIIEIQFHNLKTGNSVLELAVKHVKGIVFYDNGPLAYKIDDKSKIVKIAKDQWMNKVRSWRLK
ncbi:uncharacterized protein LOC124283631 isoform X3 [Haliotis rubra]|uniref:uncharacterized protein LOC124283631 isoform X3 n=1 Tax=Haliotis rubra TaxID=36100 RepID=UPI001EE583FF|nr:uncharacterized protein LOC124283631 isoform X3 [Haliotis rubra]